MQVTGELLDNLSSWDALRAALPVGTVSGAPKVDSCSIAWVYVCLHNVQLYFFRCYMRVHCGKYVHTLYGHYSEGKEKKPVLISFYRCP